MGAVYTLFVEQAEVSREPGGNTYQINIYWRTEESPQKYQGKYLAELYKGTEKVGSQDTEVKKATFANVELDEDAFYTLKVTVGDQPEINKTTPLMVKTYENLTGSYNGKILKLRWDEPDSGICGGKCKVKTNRSGIYSFDVRPYICGREIPMDETYFSEKEVFTVTLEPFANEYSSGPIARLESIFCPGYEAITAPEGKKQLYYRRQSPDETVLTVTLEGEIYDDDAKGQTKKPEAPVIQGPLELGITAPYQLTIKTDTLLNRTDYDSFVSKVCSLLTTAAMYQILEVIARGAGQEMEDMLYYHCGLRPDKRRADVRPGFSLRLEQAVYMPKDQMNGGDAAGFVGNHTAEYLVSLAHGEDMDYLEFDSFLSLMDEEIYPPQEQSEVRPVGAGILDMCAVRMRQPFYRIQYPEGIYSSEVEPDIHAGNHVLMLAAPGWEDVPLPLNGVLGKDGQNEETSAVPYLLFRGRSALTLIISVAVNGLEKRIPVGTTVRKLFHSIGVYGERAKEAVLYRRSPFGEEAKITFSEGPWEDMPLFHGDRIEG